MPSNIISSKELSELTVLLEKEQEIQDAILKELDDNKKLDNAMNALTGKFAEGIYEAMTWDAALGFLENEYGILTKEIGLNKQQISNLIGDWLETQLLGIKRSVDDPRNNPFPDMPPLKGFEKFGGIEVKGTLGTKKGELAVGDITFVTDANTILTADEETEFIKKAAMYKIMYKMRNWLYILLKSTLDTRGRSELTKTASGYYGIHYEVLVLYAQIIYKAIEAKLLFGFGKDASKAFKVDAGSGWKNTPDGKKTRSINVKVNETFFYDRAHKMGGDENLLKELYRYRIDILEKIKTDGEFRKKLFGKFSNELEQLKKK